MNKRSTLLALTLAGVMSLSACNMVNKKPTNEQLVNAIAKTMTDGGQAVTKEQRDKIEEALAIQAAVADAARKEGIDKLDQTKALISLQENQVLMQEYMRSKVEAYKPTDADLKALYDAEVNKATSYHFRHILVKTEAEANDIIAKLKAGGKFEVLAKQSIDPSGAKGGDLGWQPLTAWVPEFADAAAKLKTGEYTQTPVKSQFGYHVIQLVEAPRAPDAKSLPPFEQVKPQLLDLAKQNYVKKLEESFKPKKDATATPAAPAAPAAAPAAAPTAAAPEKK